MRPNPLSVMFQQANTLTQEQVKPKKTEVLFQFWLSIQKTCSPNCLFLWSLTDWSFYCQRLNVSYRKDNTHLEGWMPNTLQKVLKPQINAEPEMQGKTLYYM